MNFGAPSRKRLPLKSARGWTYYAENSYRATIALSSGAHGRGDNMSEHRHIWEGVGGCVENPGVGQIRATHPTRGGNGIALCYHHKCAICGMRKESTDYQMTDGSWLRGKPKLTTQDDYEGTLQMPGRDYDDRCDIGGREAMLKPNECLICGNNARHCWMLTDGKDGNENILVFTCEMCGFQYALCPNHEFTTVHYPMERSADVVEKGKTFMTFHCHRCGNDEIVTGPDMRI